MNPDRNEEIDDFLTDPPDLMNGALKLWLQASTIALGQEVIPLNVLRDIDALPPEEAKQKLEALIWISKVSSTFPLIQGTVELLLESGGVGSPE